MGENAGDRLRIDSPSRSVAATVEPAVDARAPSIEPAVDTIATTVQPSIDAITALVESVPESIAALLAGTVGAPIEPSIDAVAVAVEPAVDAVAPVVEAPLDAVTLAVEVFFGARSGGAGGTGDEQETGRSEGQTSDGVHGSLPGGLWVPFVQPLRGSLVAVIFYS